MYSKGGVLSDKYLIALQYACNENPDNAEAILDNINTNEFNPYQLSEHLSQVEWISFINDFSERDSIKALDSLQINYLIQIISRDSNYKSTASVFARNELIKAGNITYTESLIFNSASKSEKVKKDYPLIETQKDKSYLKVSPNPAEDFVSVQYKLPLNCSEGLIIVSSIDGKVIRKMIVSSNQNQIQLSLINVNANQLIVTLIDCKTGSTSIKLITK